MTTTTTAAPHACFQTEAGQPITIDDELRALIPPLAETEREQLEDSIIAEGCRDPLVVWNGTLIDGHHRYDICERHGIDYRTVERNFADRDAAKRWMIENQFGRRNLAPYQRAELALQLEPLIAKQAKANQRAGGGAVRQNSDNPVDTKRELARVAGLSHDSIARAKRIDAEADDATKERLRAGDTTINREYQRIVGVERKAEQVAAVESAELPAGQYHVIVADPPWRYGSRADDLTHRGRCPYPSMTVDEIKALDVADLAHTDSILWLWTTNAHMAEAYEVAAAWGFTQKTILTWAKNKMGLGDWLRGQTEHCLLCVKGTPVVRLTNETTVLHGKVREHSRKPDEFYEMVEKLCPGQKVELFARESRDGWTSHGSEKGKFTPTTCPGCGGDDFFDDGTCRACIPGDSEEVA